MAEAEHTGKRCTKCGEVKALSSFSVSRGRVYSWCKPCAAKRAADRRRAKPQTEAEKEQARTRARRWYRENRERALANVKAHTAANRDAIRERLAKYRKDNDKLRAKKAAYYRANKEAAREYRAEYHRKNAAQLIARVAEWRRQNPDAHRAQEALRRARKRGAGGKVTKEQIAAIHAGQRGRCWYCSKSLKRTGYHVEHRVPLSRGGTNGPENIVLACPPCNLRKGAKTPQEFTGRLL